MFQQFGSRGPFGPRFGGGPWRGGSEGRPHHRWEGEGGPGPRHGPRFGPFGPPRGGPRFGRGDLKFVILDLLQERPRHGYDVIRALEDRFHGFYSPSPGSVYPTLQLLEDQGYVTSSEQDGKRVYAITDAGRRLLSERAEATEGVWGRFGPGWGPRMTPELRGLVDEMRQLGQLVFRQGASGAFNDPEKVRRLAEVVARARRDVEAIFTDRPSPPTTSV